MTFSRRLFLVSSSSLALTANLGSLACATTEVKPEDGSDGEEETPKHPLDGLTDFDGKAITTYPKILDRPVTLVDFWASWCVPCRQSFRYLDQLYRTWSARGLDMVGVSVDDDPVAARRYAAQFRPSFPVAWDSNAVVRERFGVVSLPTTTLMNGDGSTVLRNVGFDLSDHRYLEEQVRRLIEIAGDTPVHADDDAAPVEPAPPAAIESGG